MTAASLKPRGGVQKRNEHQPHAKGSCRPSMHGEIKANGEAMSRSCRTRLESLPDAWGPWRRPKRRAQRKLPAWCPLKGDNRALEVHQIATLTNVCFRRQSRPELVRCTCLLLTQSGHTLGRVPINPALGSDDQCEALESASDALGHPARSAPGECMGGSI
jgi:hypothetical protein